MLHVIAPPILDRHQSCLYLHLVRGLLLGSFLLNQILVTTSSDSYSDNSCSMRKPDIGTLKKCFTRGATR
jgi:hypothetical protein